MKKCPYCGEEYPDSTVYCQTDHFALSPSSPEPGKALEVMAPLPSQQGDPTSITQQDPYLLYPDYRWRARDGWKCLGFLVVIEIVLGFMFYALRLQPTLRAWYDSGYGYVLRSAIFYAASLLTAAYFARTETFSCFWVGFGFHRKPSDYVWFGISMALIIRGIGHFLLAHHWGRGRTAYDIDAFRHTVGGTRYLYLVPLLMFAPCLEEAVNRGFLYKAFRGSYPIWFSMLLIVGWTAMTHASQYVHWIAAMDLSLLTLVQCYLREKSESLWDCVLCHLVYNGSLIFVDLFPVKA